MPVNLFTDALEALGNDALFGAIKEFSEAQPSEGWRHDYTEQWDLTALKNIAGFANAFGGLFIVGVRKGKKDVACELVGVKSGTEYKTRIASSIAANISPVPFYNVFECHDPAAPPKKYCVVRVRESKLLHLLTKKGEQPVYVRNEDESRPADAAQLRRLIERERALPNLSGELSKRAYSLRDAVWVRCGYQDKDSDTWHLSVCGPSPTFLKLEMIPTEAMPLELENSHEHRLANLIEQLYPLVPALATQDKAKEAEDRGSDYYEYIWYHKFLDYESRWRITGSGDIGHATQMRYQQGTSTPVWSVVDLARYVILFARLSMKWWESFGYFGEGHLHAQLSVPGLGLALTPAGDYMHAVDLTSSRYRASSRVYINGGAILASASPRTSANAETGISYFSSNENLPRIATSVLNQLLRSLGHVVVWESLQRSIQPLIRD